MTMQDVPIHCPADVDATDIEQMACKPNEPVKKPGDVTPQSGGGGTTNPPQPGDKPNPK